MSKVFNTMTYDTFKNGIVKYCLGKYFMSVSDIPKRLEYNYLPEFIKFNDTEDINILFEFLNKLYDEFDKSIGILYICRALIKVYIEKFEDYQGLSSNVLITLLKLKEQVPAYNICSKSDLEKLASYIIISEEDYFENSNYLSPYFETLLKRNPNLKSDSVDLLHEVTNAKLSTNITKAQRIENNRNYYMLFGTSYTIKDIVSSPSSFSWDAILGNDNYISNSKFIKEISNISIDAKLDIFRHVCAYDNYKNISKVFPDIKDDILTVINDCNFNLSDISKSVINKSLAALASLPEKLIFMYSKYNIDLRDYNNARNLILLLSYAATVGYSYYWGAINLSTSQTIEILNSFSEKFMIADKLTNKIFLEILAQSVKEKQYHNDCVDERFVASLISDTYGSTSYCRNLSQRFRDIISNVKKKVIAENMEK